MFRYVQKYNNVKGEFPLKYNITCPHLPTGEYISSQGRTSVEIETLAADNEQIIFIIRWLRGGGPDYTMRLHRNVQTYNVHPK